MLYSEFYSNTKGCADLSLDYTLYDFFKHIEKIYMGTTLSKNAIYKISNIIYCLNCLAKSTCQDKQGYKLEIMEDINELTRMVLDEDFR